MSRFYIELPNDLIKDLDKLNKDTHKMMQEMTSEGGEVVKQEIVKNLPIQLKSHVGNDNIKTTDYDSPSDDGVNTKVYLTGYFINSKGQQTPIPLIANILEHGRSNAPYPKKPFFRKSFKKAMIEKAMLKVQKKYIDE